MFIVSALTNMDTRNQASRDPKLNHLASSVW